MTISPRRRLASSTSHVNQSTGSTTQILQFSADGKKALARMVKAGPYKPKPPTSAQILKFPPSPLHLALAAAARGEPWAPLVPLEPVREQLAVFVRGLFRHTAPGATVSLRAFPDDRGGSKPFLIVPARVTELCDELTDAAIDAARRAARAPAKIVFCPPIATFNSRRRAREQDLAEAPALSVECDAHPRRARTALEKMLGPATFVVASGGEWTDPETGEIEPKLHVHWRLAVPARTKDEHAMLKEARRLATLVAGADASNITAVHPIRWPGSWHRKGAPKLCLIVADNSECEIELGAALKALKAAAPAAEVDRRAPAEPDKKLVADDPDKLAYAVSQTPNKLKGWHDWKRYGLAIFNGIDRDAGKLSEIMHEFSGRWKLGKDDPAFTDKCIEEIIGCPPRTSGPDAVGAATVFQMADKTAKRGWRARYERKKIRDFQNARGATPAPKTKEHKPLINDAPAPADEIEYIKAPSKDDVQPKLLTPPDLVLTLPQWSVRDLPVGDLLLGEILSTTTRALLSADTGLGKTMFDVRC
jgi:hypothetical protein